MKKFLFLMILILRGISSAYAQNDPAEYPSPVLNRPILVTHQKIQGSFLAPHDDVVLVNVRALRDGNFVQLGNDRFPVNRGQGQFEIPVDGQLQVGDGIQARVIGINGSSGYSDLIAVVASLPGVDVLKNIRNPREIFKQPKIPQRPPQNPF